MEIFPRLIGLAQYTVHIKIVIGCYIDFRITPIHFEITLLKKLQILGLRNKAICHQKLPLTPRLETRNI